MPATILAGHLLAAVRTAGRAASRQRNIPILGNVLLEAKGGRITAAATDMEVMIATSAAATGQLRQVTVSARGLGDLLAFLPAEAEIELEFDRRTESLTVMGGGVNARLLTLPPEDFPAPKVAQANVSFEMPASKLLRLLRLVSSAISREETRYYLNGIYLHLATAEGRQVLRSVATDGHRLMLADEAVPAGAEGLKGGIIPHGTVAMLLAMLPGKVDAPISITFGDLRAVFSCQQWALTSKLIDGTFPEYHRVFPVGPGAGIAVKSARGFVRALETAAALSLQRSRPVRFSNGDGTSLRLGGSCPDTGEAEFTVPEDVAAWEEGAAHPVFGAQARYLHQICATLPNGFRMEVLDGTAPVRILFEGGAGLLMPMRI